MKENNKFSLSAFFCSLGSKSKIFMFFLLGVPFLLVQIFTLKVYANSAVIPVIPEGLTTSGITSNGIVPGDPSLLYYTVLIALGLKADEVYQVNKGEIINSVTDSLNEFDSVNDPTLGNDLQTYLEWVDNAKTQNGYINELSIPRSLWNRLNKATSSGLNLRISNAAGDSISKVSFTNWVTDFLGYNVSSSDIDQLYNYIELGSSVYGYNTISNNNVSGKLILYNGQLSGSIFISDGAIDVNGVNVYGYAQSYLSNSYRVVRINDQFNVMSYFNLSSASFVSSYNTSFVNKSVGVARPFITSKANNTYDVLSKSGVINDTTGDLEGDVTMSVLSPDRLKDIASDYEDVATDIPVFFPDSRLVPIDIENPNEIPDSVGIPGDTPQEIIDSLADTIDPSPAEPIVIQPFNYIDQWDPFIPDPTPETPLVGLSAVMNWLAEQMQTTMYLTQFSNCWLVLSTLVVAACLIGLVRIWR